MLGHRHCFALANLRCKRPPFNLRLGIASTWAQSDVQLPANQEPGGRACNSYFGSHSLGRWGFQAGIDHLLLV